SPPPGENPACAQFVKLALRKLYPFRKLWKRNQMIPAMLSKPPASSPNCWSCWKRTRRTNALLFLVCCGVVFSLTSLFLIEWRELLNLVVDSIQKEKPGLKFIKLDGTVIPKLRGNPSL